MSSINLDNIDRKLLSLLQAEFPLTREPYADLGLKLGIGSNAVIQRIYKLKAKGIIRQIGPVLDARKLGYQSTLVAMKVAADQLARAEQVIGEHPLVSHGYERDHDFNIWITLALPQEADITTELQQLTSATGAEAIFALPAVKVFKLRAYFDMNGDEPVGVDSGSGTDLRPRRAELSPIERLIINELQQDLPLMATPFAPLATPLDMDADDFLRQCRSLLRRGILRRFGAAINHREAGFQANAMTCWVAPPDMVDTAGRELAGLRQVSHCYERQPNSLWRYNLFAMVHAHTREACRKTVNDVSRRLCLTDYVLLFSTKEFKKTRVKYPV